MIRTLQLTLSHVGLGDLRESALLEIFAGVQAEALTAGTGVPLDEMVDRDGRMLYPAYYHTHLRVPPDRPLEQHRLWREVAVGVDVRTFGRMLLDSTYVLGRPGEVEEDPARWEGSGLPVMRGANMFVVDGLEGEPQVSVPKAGCVAALPGLTAPPPSMDRFRRARTEGSLAPHFQGNLASSEPVRYRVARGRDAAPGRNMPFSRFTDIMEHAEWALLAERVAPAFPLPLLDSRRLLERETFYFDNCRGGEVVETRLRARLARCRPDLHGTATDVVSAGLLTTVLELTQHGTNALLAVSRARKLFLVPTARQSVLRDAERLLFQHTAENDREDNPEEESR